MTDSVENARAAVTPSSETKLCPHCGMNMIERRRDVVLLSFPPILSFYWWCGNCQYEEFSRTFNLYVDEMKTASRRWREANHAPQPPPAREPSSGTSGTEG